MTQITLYGPREAPFTVKVERALRIKKLPYTLVEPSGPEDFRRWSPETGLLPVAEIGAERVHDSTRIVERIDELFPEPPLFSSDLKLAEQQRRLEDWCDETFFFYWLRWRRLRDAEESRAPRRFGLLTWVRDLALARGPVRRGRGGFSAEVADLIDEIRRRCDDLVNMLSGRSFFYGDRPSLADLAIYAMLHSMRQGNLPNGPVVVAERPSLVEFMKRVEDASGD